MRRMAHSGSPPIVLITGATGYIGRRLTHHLLASQRYTVRLFVRNQRKVQATIADAVEIHEGSTFEPETLVAALEDVDTAFYLIHSMGSDEDYRKLDRESAENFRRACVAAGVRRIIYLGGLGNRNSASKHLLSRIETGETLCAEPGRISTIWFRAGVIVGSGSASFEIIRNLCHKLPFMLTPLWVRTKTEAIGIEDVLAYLEQAIELPTKENLVVDIGSGKITFQEMITGAAEAMGLRRFLVPVPVLSPKISSYWLILFTSVPYRVASSLVEGLKSETIKENDHARMYFPAIEPMSYTDSVAHAMQELEQNQIVSRWCDSSSEKACDIKDFDDPVGAVLRDIRIVPYDSQTSQDSVYRSVCALGGPNGWFRYNFLWRLRGALDKLSGGYGLSRGRRDKVELRVGDALDFWKVVDIKPGKRLLLYAQMKVPGQAWLEFDVQPEQLVQTAHFIPHGVLGRIYWYSVLPLHYLVFSNLARTVVQESGKYDN
jgi:uncharacterized protein YbjT (DUF2867 family)